MSIKLSRKMGRQLAPHTRHFTQLPICHFDPDQDTAAGFLIPSSVFLFFLKCSYCY